MPRELEIGFIAVSLAAVSVVVYTVLESHPGARGSQNRHEHAANQHP
jgi:hypothetical protein